MTERPDPVDLLLAQLRVPAVAPDLAARIVAAAQRPGRVPLRLPPRRNGWSRARRGAWTALIAVNLVLASAVAAAIGGGGRYLPAPIAHVAHHIVERLRAHLFPLRHRAVHAVAVHPARRPAARPVAPPRGNVVEPLELRPLAPGAAEPRTIVPIPLLAPPPFVDIRATPAPRFRAERRLERGRLRAALGPTMRRRLVIEDRALHRRFAPRRDVAPRFVPDRRDLPLPPRARDGEDRGLGALREPADGGLRRGEEHSAPVARDQGQGRDAADGDGAGRRAFVRRERLAREERGARAWRDGAAWRDRRAERNGGGFRGPRGGGRGRRFR